VLRFSSTTTRAPAEGGSLAPAFSADVGLAASAEAAAHAAGAAAAPSVVLVTLDGVRWQDVFESSPRAWPRTWALLEQSGVALGHGTGCGIVRPRNTTHISLPGYLEIFTGRRTKCMSNVCPKIAEATVLDVAAAAGIATASISSWDGLDLAASHRRAPSLSQGADAFVSAGTRWPGPRPLDDPRLEAAVVAGEQARPFPATAPPYRPDRYTTRVALEYLRACRPRLLHIGLGDTDEHAHRDDRKGYDQALRTIDDFLGELARTLEAEGAWSTATVIVVSDHGRSSSVFREHGANWPESGRSFVLAFGGRVSKRGEACAKRDVWLTDVAPTLRALLALPRDASPEGAGTPIVEIFPP
jgi:hypothetical protein